MVAQTTNPSKSELARLAILADPSRSDREIARELGVGNKTVSRARKALIDGGFLATNSNDTLNADKSMRSVSFVATDSIFASPENDLLYRPVLDSDPEIIKLAKSIQQHGLLEPVVVSLDHYILSGHRRHCACRIAGLTQIPVSIEQVRRSDDIDKFTLLLREHNRQRDKNVEEMLREELLTISPAKAYRTLIEHREMRSKVSDDVLEIDLLERRNRHSISDDKRDFAYAIQATVEQYKAHWPLTDRRIHYFLLNKPPIRNTSAKHWAKYQNDKASYRDLTDMLTRLRLAGHIKFESITDPTRPIEEWDCWDTPRKYLRQELDDFAQRYWRDLMQTQPNHIEVLAEKNTVLPSVRNVAMKYCIPVTSGRGHSSLEPRWQMYQRFKKSGKTKLVIVVVSDFDPAGCCIAESFCRSMRDDFRIRSIVPIKASLTHQQTIDLGLPADGLTPKKSDGQRAAFQKKYGKDQCCYELEAIPPETLERLLTEAIDSVIDKSAFNAELDAEKEDAAFIAGVRNVAIKRIEESLKTK